MPALKISGAAALVLLASSGCSKKTAICDGVAQDAARIWSSDARSSVEKAYVQGGASPEMARKAVEALDRVKGGVEKRSAQQCKALDAAQAGSEARERTRACFDDVLLQLETTVATLKAPNAERALYSTGALFSLDTFAMLCGERPYVATFSVGMTGPSADAFRQASRAIAKIQAIHALGYGAAPSQQAEQALQLAERSADPRLMITAKLELLTDEAYRSSSGAPAGDAERAALQGLLEQAKKPGQEFWHASILARMADIADPQSAQPLHEQYRQELRSRFGEHHPYTVLNAVSDLQHASEQRDLVFGLKEMAVAQTELLEAAAKPGCVDLELRAWVPQAQLSLAQLKSGLLPPAALQDLPAKWQLPAPELALQALAGMKELYGSDSPQVAAGLGIVGSIHRFQQPPDSERALEVFHEARKLQERLVASGSKRLLLELAQTYQQLVDIYKDRKNDAQRLIWFERYVQTVERALGPNPQLHEQLDRLREPEKNVKEKLDEVLREQQH